MSETQPSRSVTFEKDGPLGLITIEAPPLNLFGRAMTTDLVTSVDEAVAADIRALVIRARGRVFTGGVDVSEFLTLNSQTMRELLIIEEVIHKLEALPIPTLAIVHAVCLTAGFELSLGCDLIWAGESAKFGLVERVVGVTPFMGGTQRIAERAGSARAREVVYSGALFDAATLERWNVVNRVLPDAELEEQALAFARDLAIGPTIAHGATKAIVRAAADHGVKAADALVPEVLGAVLDSEDFKGGVRTFVEKGPGHGVFAGR